MPSLSLTGGREGMLLLGIKILFNGLGIKDKLKTYLGFLFRARRTL